MNLLRLFEFYLMAMFVIGLVRRIGLYQAMARLAMALARRYRRLFGVVREQNAVLLTWSMAVRAVVTLVLWALQSILTRLVFPHAELTARDVLARWWFVPAVLVSATSMVAVDVFFLVRVATVDADETEQYFSQAESWLGTWKASAVRAVTFGYVNPRKMVDAEVRKALESGGKLIHSSLWWTAVQTGTRVATGLALWAAWTFGPSV